jgi:hypothetical protein
MSEVLDHISRILDEIQALYEEHRVQVFFKGSTMKKPPDQDYWSYRAAQRDGRWVGEGLWLTSDRIMYADVLYEAKGQEDAERWADEKRRAESKKLILRSITL